MEDAEIFVSSDIGHKSVRQEYEVLHGEMKPYYDYEVIDLDHKYHFACDRLARNFSMYFVSSEFLSGSPKSLDKIKTIFSYINLRRSGRTNLYASLLEYKTYILKNDEDIEITMHIYYPMDEDEEIKIEDISYKIVD